MTTLRYDKTLVAPVHTVSYSVSGVDVKERMWGSAPGPQNLGTSGFLDNILKLLHHNNCDRRLKTA